MEEIDYREIANVSPQDRAILEKIVSLSKANGVQIGVPWSQEVYSYLFENELSPFDETGILGMDILAEEI